ncbi:Stealth CR1 domain-containing protein [Furfurilactobacillus curtus]|uniref:Exopolysaccharide phosphotransferase cps2G n=1 Tax=Furfurilactobacillus curtus TaxID=1746200 RepID=A0ABQ5JN56_9LACO
MDKQIDVVIPWVDGEDSDWKRKRQRFNESKTLLNDENNTSNRYRDYGTLKYVLRSIDKNMSWVGRIFLLTDHQVPSWINKEKVIIVDHSDFIVGALPTFNSNVILTSIGNIKELGDFFIVFNDETLVVNRTKRTDFFRNGLPVDSLIETGTVPMSDGFFHISSNGVALINQHFSKRKVMKKHLGLFFNYHYGVQNLRTFLSLPYGGFLGFYNQHLIMPFRKADFEQAYDTFFENFASTWNHRFREFTDINEWAIRYLRNVNGNFAPGFLKGQFFTLSDFQKQIPKIKKKSKVVVINDDGCANEEAFNKVNDFLETNYPQKSKYEK